MNSQITEIKFNPNKFSRRIPYLYAKNNRVCIYGTAEDKVLLATTEDLTPSVITEIKRKLKQPLAVTRVEPGTFNNLLSEAYSSSNAAAIIDDVQEDIDISDLIHNLPKFEDLLETEDDAPIIRIINAFLTQAVKENASDIHLDAYERNSRVRFRKDGTLRNIAELNPNLHSALVSRVKIMAQLDIAEKRLPQDGRIALRLAGKEVDLRVSTIPTVHGERIVMRLLDKNKERLNLDKLGMQQDTLAKLDKLIHSPHGIFLVTGPTGSGKSTTLYAALTRFDAKAQNIMTVEDPIEYNLDGISQTQVNSKIDMTFAKALRAILRQDPDIVLIGEIRDLETAQIAVQASLTGHLVLATLHTNNAASAVTRLTDIGVEPFLLSSCVIGILAQRLIRLLCANCKQETFPDAMTRQEFALPETTKVYAANGCELCDFTGYKDRTGIHELLIIDEEARRIIHNQLGDQQLEAYALKKLGMRTLRMDARNWILKGQTSIEEVVAVTKD